MKSTGDRKDQETRPFVLDVCCGSRLIVEHGAVVGVTLVSCSSEVVL